MMTAVSASQPGWLKGQRILRIGSGIHSQGCRRNTPFIAASFFLIPVFSMFTGVHLLTAVKKQF